ncbi:MAG: DUF6497 family protein [Pseudomonadota bacterium]
MTCLFVHICRVFRKFSRRLGNPLFKAWRLHVTGLKCSGRRIAHMGGMCANWVWVGYGLCFATLPVLAQPPLVVPSGQALTLYEALIEEQGDETVLVLRYLAPEISRAGGVLTYDQVTADLDHLCATDGLAAASRENQQIIVTLMDRPLPRGQTNPDITQFFAAYRRAGQSCIWEPF